MAPRDRIGAAIKAATAAGRPAIVGFLTAGFPDKARFRQHLAAVAAGVDVVEIGVPFTDPMADGATIQRASHAALTAGVTLTWILGELRANAGIVGFIVPDLPYEESADLRAALGREGLALVQMVTPVTPLERLKLLCAASEGFVYAVTMTGTTGKSVAVPDEVLAYLDRVRAASPIPVCAGFGIRGREQVERLKDHVDGVVVGSALVEVLERGEDVTRWCLQLRP